MLVIRVELWPGGREEESRTIAGGAIVNDGSGTPQVADYVGGFRSENHVTLDFYIRGHERKEDVWRLIHKALGAALEEKDEQTGGSVPGDGAAGSGDGPDRADRPGGRRGVQERPHGLGPARAGGEAT